MKSVLVFPAYDDNPFLSILLGSARSAGFRVRSVVALPDFVAEADELGPGDVIHMNWTAQVTQRPRTPWGAAQGIRRLLAAIDRAKARGAKLIWTLHNALAHDARNVQQDARLGSELAARADIIHVMNRATERLVTDYRLPPDRIRIIPHPSYSGVYDRPADSRSQETARELVGASRDRFAVLMLGHMKPYKGALDLIAAAETSSRPLTLMLAGRGTTRDWRAIDAAIGDRLHAVVHRDYVNSDEVPLWFDAADVTVLPYRRILNSGSALLSATFGVPVVMPDEPSVLAEFGDEEWVVTYDRNDQVAGIRRVLNDASIDWAAKGRAALAFADTVRPEVISDRFLALLRELSA